MMIEPHLHYQSLICTPTVHNPPRVTHSNPTATIIPSPSSPMAPSPLSAVRDSSPTASYDAVLTALYRYMQSNEPDGAVNDMEEADELAILVDGAYASTDEFRMYEFKVRPCTRAKAHDWTECPFAHPGEKARRRDPRRYPYSGTACTDFRKGSCMRGDACEFAHGVFECWLHPARYRTQACKDGPNCPRRVCFFAHSPDQLRIVSGLPSPRSIGSGPDPFDDPDSPSSPVAPIGRAYGSGTMNELVTSLRNLQLSKVKSMPTGSGWKVQVGLGSPRFGPTGGPVVGQVFYSSPTTPTQTGGPGYWEAEEAVMERVESGRELRARMFEKLSKENPLTLPDPVETGPDVGWVTELVK